MYKFCSVDTCTRCEDFGSSYSCNLHLEHSKACTATILYFPVQSVPISDIPRCLHQRKDSIHFYKHFDLLQQCHPHSPLHYLLKHPHYSPSPPNSSTSSSTILLRPLLPQPNTSHPPSQTTPFRPSASQTPSSQPILSSTDSPLLIFAIGLTRKNHTEESAFSELRSVIAHMVGSGILGRWRE